jgi:hypothetical protein
MCTVMNSMGVAVSYETIRRANGDEPYRMSLPDGDQVKAVIRAVNQGIDAHLEACSMPHRGDRYEVGKRKVGDRVFATTLECVVSPESLPTLMRRLTELRGVPKRIREAGEDLAHAMFESLRIDDYGNIGKRDE